MANKLNMTAEEADRLGKLIKDPEFIQLFGEFAREMQDPKASAEMNEYMRQLEAEGQAEHVYGKGVQLIVPEASFVVKTKEITGGTRVYINICTSPKVGEMQQEARQGPSSNGVFLSIPMVVHAKEAKTGTAPDGGCVLVWDIAVNPNATAEAAKRRGVLNALVDSALERIEHVSSIKLLREYKLPKLKYKSVPGAEQPSVMAARTGKGGEVVDGKLHPSSAAATMPSTSSDCSTATDSNGKRSRSSFSFNSQSKGAGAQPSQQQQQQQISSTIVDPWVAGYRHACGAVTPNWRLIERVKTDLGTAWADTGRGLRAASSIPQALVIKVELPGVDSAAALQLDVGSDAVHLGLHGKYNLDLSTAQLKYKLLAEQGAAKFDKAKQQLTITLQVAPLQETQQPQQVPDAHMSPTPPKHPAEPAQKQHCNQQQHELMSNAPMEPAQQWPHDIVTSSADAPCHNSSTTACKDAVAFVSRRTSPEQQPTSKTTNQLLWEQLHGSLDQQQHLHQQEGQGAERSSEEMSAVHEQVPQQHQQQTAAPAPRLKARMMSWRLNAADLD